MEKVTKSFIYYLNGLLNFHRWHRHCIDEDKLIKNIHGRERSERDDVWIRENMSMKRKQARKKGETIPEEKQTAKKKKQRKCVNKDYWNTYDERGK